MSSPCRYAGDRDLELQRLEVILEEAGVSLSLRPTPIGWDERHGADAIGTHPNGTIIYASHRARYPYAPGAPP